jgi:hypothetical protein
MRAYFGLTIGFVAFLNADRLEPIRDPTPADGS